MRKVKLIIGTYNSQPPEEVSSVVEEYYQKAYKTFLTTLYNFSSIKASLHYSGALFEWIEEEHPEFISVLQEMVNNRQIEMLSGGYYDPALTLLPVTDRVGQMEKLTTYIRKSFGKRPRGCFITESVWDSTLVSSLKTCGFDYIFLDENQFLSSGILEENINKPVITEDMGKIITVFPISNSLTSMFLRRPPQELIDYLREHLHTDGVFTILFKGEYLMKYGTDVTSVKEWLEEFNTLLEENSSWIETINPTKYVKQVQGELERTYFPQYSINGMRNKPLPLVGQKELNRLTRHLGALGDVSHWINSGFFKQFLARYKDSAQIYAKMVYVNILINQIKGDRSRKKTAREELWRSQSHYVYWHGNHLGIYDKRLRERTYKFLIEAEKSAREQGIFQAGLNHIDIDLDGKKEILYQGDLYNGYLTTKGGVLFQLDYIKRPHNMCATVMRLEEAYHQQNRGNFDTYERKLFHDHFITADTKPEQLQDNSHRELGNFIHNSYEFDSILRDKKTVEQVAKGHIDYLGSEHQIVIKKKYKFNKKGIVLTYSIENCDDLPIETQFSPEMNFSLGGLEKETAATYASDKDHFKLDGITSTKDVGNCVIEDPVNHNKIHLSFSKETDKFWTIPQFSESMSDGEVGLYYQFTSFFPVWKLKLTPGQVWTLAINLSIT